jgi:hypothetical protein
MRLGNGFGGVRGSRLAPGSCLKGSGGCGADGGRFSDLLGWLRVNARGGGVGLCPAGDLAGNGQDGRRRGGNLRDSPGRRAPKVSPQAEQPSVETVAGHLLIGGGMVPTVGLHAKQADDQAGAVPSPTYHLPPTTYHLPPTTYHLPPTTYHLPPTTYPLPPAVYCLPSTAYYLAIASTADFNSSTSSGH